MKQEQLIIDLLKEARKEQKEHSNILTQMQIDVELNRKDLEEHMEQTRAVKDLALTVREEANTRIEKIEEKLTVSYLLKLIVTVASGISVVAGAIYAVSRLF